MTSASKPDGVTDNSLSANFDRLTAPHYRVLAAIAASEVGLDAALDVVQETLLRAWRRSANYQVERGSIRVWLIAILRNECRRHQVRQQRSRRLESEMQPENHALDDSDLNLEVAISQLAPRQKQVVTLHYLAELSTAEIASLLSLSQGTVKSTLHDARNNLKQKLARGEARNGTG